MSWRVPDDFTGTVVVVTGASSGIGRAAALAFAERGASVVLASRDPSSLHEVATGCEAAGGAALAVATDVSDEDAVQTLAAKAVDRFGRVDVWVNNAAVMIYGRFEDVPGKVHRQALATNLLGQVYGARAVLPYFRRQERGVLINVSSLYARMTSPYVSAYVTSKFGILGFSEVLRQELHDAPGIAVCTILPGSVDTPIFHHAANYTSWGARPVPPVSDPQRVVRAILRCAHRPRRETVVGQTARALSLAHAVVPGLYDRLVPYVVERAALRSETVEPGPGNVFSPVTGGNQVTGGWRDRRRRRLSLAGLVAAAAATSVAVWQGRRPRGGHAGISSGLECLQEGLP